MTRQSPDQLQSDIWRYINISLYICHSPRRILVNYIFSYFFRHHKCNFPNKMVGEVTFL